MKRLCALTLSLALTLAGCASPPTQAPTPDPAPAASLSPVFTDWSQLTPYEPPKEVYTRRYPGFTGTLIPAGDYGRLFPYVGEVIVHCTSWTDGEGQDYYYEDDYPLSGLVTQNGEIVTDPVFSSILEIHPDQPYGQPTDGCFRLEKTVLDENGDPDVVCALAALDGSWVTPFDYRYDWELTFNADLSQYIPMWKGNNEIVFLSTRDGRELQHFDLSPFLELPDIYRWQFAYRLRGRYMSFQDPDFRDNLCHIFDLATGEVNYLPNTVAEIGEFSEGLCSYTVWSDGQYLKGYLDETGSSVIPPKYTSAGIFQDGAALVTNAWSTSSLIDRTGQTLYTFPELSQDIWKDGPLWRCQLSNGRTLYLDEELKPIPLPQDFTDPTFFLDGWFLQQLPAPSPAQAGSFAFWNRHTGQRRDFPDSYRYDWALTDNWVILRSTANNDLFFLADLNSEEITPLGEWYFAYLSRDSVTQVPYLILMGQDDQPSQLRTLDGRTLYTTSDVYSASLRDGYITASDNGCAVLVSPQGKTVFSKRISTPRD